MRIAFVGKGGAGKTTLVSLFTRWLVRNGQSVLAIDADINQHLGTALGFSSRQLALQPPLGNEIVKLKEYLRGSNPRIASVSQMIKTTPPGAGSQLIRFSESGTILDHFLLNENGVRFLASGPFTEEDLGQKCYHSKIGGVELLLNHLIDGPNEYVAVDMTAGADAFASGLFTRFDLTVLVVEPTVRGVSVYRQYQEYAKDYEIQLVAIGNKVADLDDVAFLQAEIGDRLIGTFGQSRYVRSLERGEIADITDLEPINIAVLATLKRRLDGVERDWQRSYELAVTFHAKNALGWANATAGVDLREQIDPTFRILDVISIQV